VSKRIVTWNVNGIRSVHRKGFLEWISLENPDILCLQETKAHPEQLPGELTKHSDYQCFWASAKRRGYSGLATYTKEKPLEVENLGDAAFDDEGRVQIIHYEGFSLVNAYFPNSQEKGKRLDYKLAFCHRLHERLQALEKEGRKLLLCGDYNIAHKAIDLKNPDQNVGNPGYLPEERAWMDHFTASGFIDTFRHFNSEPDHYTWWSYRTRARERNAGWRIDYHCVNESMLPEVKSCTILCDVMGSDHCPVRVTL